MSQFQRLTPTKKQPDQPAYRAVHNFYEEVCSQKFHAEFNRWSAAFRLIHGELQTQRQADLYLSAADYDLIVEDNDQFLRLVFALETYYSVVLVGLAHKAVAGSTHFPIDDLLNGDELRRLRVFNYSAPSWCLWVGKSNVASAAATEVLREVEGIEIGHYDKDVVKHLFHEIFSKSLRHSLGEIYTPDWLAELTISDAIKGNDDAEQSTYLDPTCGSGTFLVEVVRRFLPLRGKQIAEQVFGFDINPVSALAAKTNFLLFCRDYFDEDDFWIPIFEADCLRTSFSRTDSLHLPSQERLESDLIDEGRRILDAAPSYAGLIRECSQLLKSKKLSSRQCELLLAELAATAISNIGYVIGNPPWVNWEYLPQEYKLDTSHIWQYYKLFDLRGRDATFIKEDISSLITYAVADRFLRTGGTLAFVIKQSLFKSSKQAQGFRRFHIAPTNTPLKVIKVEDLTAIRPFPGIAARTAILLIKKGEKTNYPVQYNEWKPRSRASFREDETLSSVLDCVSIEQKQAFPSDADDQTSGWTTSAANRREGIDSVLGTNGYRARTGLFTGGLNAAFWMRAIESRGTNLLVQNMSERAKNKLPERQVEIECDLLYPFVTGADLDLWSFTYSRYVLCTHTALTKIEPMQSATLEQQYPRAWNYLLSLRQPLAERKGFAGWEKSIHEKYFYALQRIGEYTFAPYKVAWRFISNRFRPVVISAVDDPYLGRSIPIPNEKVIFIGCDDMGEAYYLCGVLSSSSYREAVESFMVSTQVGPHVLDKLNIPKYDPSRPQHQKISEACKAGHNGTADIIERNLAIVEAELRNSDLTP